MMETGTIEGLFIIPEGDKNFLKTLAQRMGWIIQTKKATTSSLMDDIELSLYQAKDMKEGKFPRTSLNKE